MDPILHLEHIRCHLKILYMYNYILKLDSWWDRGFEPKGWWEKGISNKKFSFGSVKFTHAEYRTLSQLAFHKT